MTIEVSGLKVPACFDKRTITQENLKHINKRLIEALSVADQERFKNATGDIDYRFKIPTHFGFTYLFDDAVETHLKVSRLLNFNEEKNRFVHVPPFTISTFDQLESYYLDEGLLEAVLSLHARLKFKPLYTINS